MLLELKNVSKKLGTFQLDNISFELPKGYIMGLIGPNGSGKTSLLHLILGLYQPDNGDVSVDTKNYSEHEIQIREHIGVVLSETLFDESLSLLQNGSTYGKFYETYSEDTLRTYLTRFELNGKKKYGKLSKGEQLKFQFAFALSHDTRLLILDEPTGNFDLKFREEFFASLKSFIADGKRSVILATHLTEDLDQIADYILYLEKGKSIFNGDIETLRESYRLLTGEEYKLKLLPKERLIHIEKGNYGTQALVHHYPKRPYDDSLTVSIPTIEQLMYFMTKREGL